MPGVEVWIDWNGPPVTAAGLGIEGLELAGPAGEPEQDAALLIAAQLLGDRGRAEDLDARSCRRTPPRPPRASEVRKPRRLTTCSAEPQNVFDVSCENPP